MRINTLSAQPVDGLNIVQFETETRDTFAYRTSVRALNENLVTVTEVGDQGSVNHLLVENTSDSFVFFMDGDILAGAKQNRVLNLSLLLAPRSKTVVPVSCIERGRWRAVSRTFAATDHSAPPSLRAFKSSSLARQAQRAADFMADQAGVWHHVAAMKAEHAAAAPTDNLSDVFAEKQAKFDRALQELRPAPGANGLAVFAGDKLISLDVFNRADVLMDYLPRLVRGMLLDAIRVKGDGKPIPADQLAEAIRQQLEAGQRLSVDTRPGVGVGTERRYETRDVVGFELSYEARPIHVSILGKTA